MPISLFYPVVGFGTDRYRCGWAGRRFHRVSFTPILDQVHEASKALGRFDSNTGLPLKPYFAIGG